MANYMAVTRTNYFRVTDEDRYKELFEMLISEDDIQDFTKRTEDGVILHGFGCYGDVECYDEENDEYYFDEWLSKLQEIIPDDEAFILESSGYEKLRYVTGWVVVVTRKEIASTSCDSWAKKKAKELLGEDFETQTDY